ncbi:MAG: hypothetical protein OXU81_23215 [Gammaproteobacteria bacterium]|nr:hypothetical protein [Gammaproteobacteria bacterium]
MSRTTHGLTEEFAAARRLVRQCRWLAAFNLALPMLCTARVYELI